MNLAMALGYATSCIYDPEGFSSKAYLDKLAKPPVWTIGHGTTRVDGQPVHEGMTCTEAEAEDWAMADMNQAATYVQHTIKVPLTEPQLGALISFCYNLGDGNFHGSTVKAALDHGLYAVAADRLLEYDCAGGKQYAGLDTRRARERAMFLRGTSVAVASIATAQPAGGAPVTEATTRRELIADDLNQAQLDRLA